VSEFENTNSQQGRRGNPMWQAGVSGNPAGRPPGARNRATVLAETLLDDEAEAVVRKAIERAKEGDMAAIRLVMDRICPPRKERPIRFALPKLEQPSDAVAAAALIVEAVASGDLTASEATELSRVVAAYATALEAANFDARLSKLEAERI
jgi:Family of unknown function (DUF5681)